MTLFFDLHILERDTKEDPEYLVRALYYFYKGIMIPNKLYSKYKPLPNLKKGSSFLLNPKGFFSDYSDTVYRAQYIKLAGRRDYMDYITNLDTTLNLSMFADINISAIQHNPMIKIINNKIKFKYEELIWH